MVFFIIRLLESVWVEREVLINGFYDAGGTLKNEFYFLVISLSGAAATPAGHFKYLLSFLLLRLVFLSLINISLTHTQKIT